ncbi:MAG: hypothetical protein MJZ90_06190 [Bacteroidales bacterium]|nr:hypothetical protein [Bacteroidales bacterium]
MLDKIVKNDRTMGIVAIATLAILVVLLVRSNKQKKDNTTTPTEGE